MSDYSQLLNLSPESLDTLVIAYRGYAQALEALSIEPQESETEKQDRQFLKGSSYAIAATYSVVRNPEKALTIFREAARVFAGMNHPYWKILALCGRFDELLYTQALEETQQLPLADAFLYEYLRQFYMSTMGSNSNSFQRLRDEAAERPSLTAQYVGRLGIPLQTYIYAIEDLAQIRNLYRQNKGMQENLMARTLNNWFVLLTRNYEHQRLTQADQYHWNLIMNILPIELEILAASICFCTYLTREIGDPNLFVRFSNSDPKLELPLLIAREISTSDNDNFLDRL